MPTTSRFRSGSLITWVARNVVSVSRTLNKLLDFLDGPTGLALVPDAFRNHPANRTAPGAPTFNVTYAFLTSAGPIREFRFVFTDTSISYGVLRVDYADER